MVPMKDWKTILMDFENPASYVAELHDLTSAALLISASTPGTFVDDLSSEIRMNVLPYSLFLKAINGTSISRVLYFSSGGTVYGPAQVPLIDEEHPTVPISPYGCGKLMIESMIKTLSAEADWSYTILRPTNPIGPFQNAKKGQGLIAAAVNACLFGREIEIWGDGSSVRDYFDVRGLCRAAGAALSSPQAEDQVFNVSSGRGLSVNDVLNLVEMTIGSKIKRNYSFARPVDVGVNILDNKKILEFLGIDINSIKTETIAKIVDEQRMNPNTYEIA